MLLDSLKLLFNRDLNRLSNEIRQYEKEALIWKTEKLIANSAGNLCLHLLGNLNTYIGNEIGKSGYVRNRELEFSIKNVPKEELLFQISDTISIVNKSLNSLNESLLENEYAVLVFDQKTSTGYMLIHLSSHVTYHLGQINYHRRLIGTE